METTNTEDYLVPLKFYFEGVEVIENGERFYHRLGLTTYRMSTKSYMCAVIWTDGKPNLDAFTQAEKDYLLTKYLQSGLPKE